MSWYAAHVVMAVRFSEGPVAPIPVWENVVLVSAPSDDEAYEKAEGIGRSNEGDDDGSFRWDGRRATWEFKGVRKLTLCDYPWVQPGDGSEVTYLELELATEADLETFAAGDPVGVRVVDPFPDEADVPASAPA